MAFGVQHPAFSQTFSAEAAGNEKRASVIKQKLKADRRMPKASL